MAPEKRKHSESVDSDDGYSEVSLANSEDEVDISSALTGKRPKVTPRLNPQEDDDDDDDLQEFIRESITKRDVKEGTELIKKTKGKAKISKGEIGGGSFQSMGTHIYIGCSAGN